MEPDIHSTLPNSSPILAYGEQRGLNYRMLFPIGAISLLAVLLGLLTWLVFNWTIPFPANVPFLMAVPASSDLERSFPNVWGSAGSAARGPHLIGLALSNGRYEPFVLTSSFSAFDAPVEQRLGSFVFLSDRAIDLDSKKYVRSLFSLVAALFRKTPFIEMEELRGPVIDLTWNTNASVTGPSVDTLPSGDVSMNVDALPGAWPLLRQALMDTGRIGTIDEQPSSFGWHITTSSLPIFELRYANGVPSSTFRSVAASAGVFDISKSTLEDGTLIEELLPPQSAQDATGTTFYLTTTTVGISDPDVQPLMQDGCIQKSPILRLSKTAIGVLARRLGVPIPENIELIEAGEVGGKLIFCIK